MRWFALNILILGLAIAPVAVAADSSVNNLTLVNSATSASKSSTQASEGKSASEVLPGNGGCAGYMLGHGNVISGSEWVYIGAKRAKRNTDYTIDYSSGAIYFAEPVRQCDSVKVDYKYSDTADTQRNLGVPGLSLSFGGNSNMSLTYAYRAADQTKNPGSKDILTYGVNSSMKLGGTSTLSSMMYMATPQTANRLSLGSSQTTSTKAADNVHKDRLMVQNADLGLGKVRLKLGYQDVGEGFAGFSSLRDSKAAATDILNQLEKEKGIKRMDLAGGLAVGTGSELSFAMGRIEDKNDEINTMLFGYAGSIIKFDFSSRDIGKQFSRFNDLKESDRAQMAAEIGMNRTNYGMQIRTGTGADNNPVWSGIRSTQLQGDTGGLSDHSADLDFGNIKVQADIRTMDKGFNHMSALNDEERSRMALIARRQFNPNANIKDVTDDDRSQFNSEAGLNRSEYSVQFDGGGINTWLSMTNVDSEKGGLNRTAIQIEGKQFKFFFNHHSIDQGFSRLCNLQAIERSNFGNEYGMSRTTFGGNFKMNLGEIVLNHSSVLDHQGASLVRQSLDFKNPRLKFHANFQDIDSKFSRISDLSDSDKEQMIKDQGFKRADYSFNFQATKYLNIDSYMYNSNNITEGQTRGQNRYKITYTPKTGPQVTAFQDSYSYISETGNLTSYARRKLTFDNKFNFLGGLAFNMLSDANTTQEGSENPVDTNIMQTHVESNQNLKTSFTMDTFNADYGEGKFEETQSVGVKTKAVDNISFVCSVAQTNKEQNKSETNGTVGFDWKINKDLKMSMNVNNRDGDINGCQKKRQFSLNGLLAKRFLCFNDIKIGSGVNTSSLRGKQTGCDNSLKIESGVMGGNFLFDNSDKLNAQKGIYCTSRIIQYESDKDPKKIYHFKYFKQNLVTPFGNPAKKCNYSLDFKCSDKINFVYTSYFGKDAQNGDVSPIGGSNYKISHVLNSKSTIFADYTSDVNDLTRRHAHIFGLGFTGILPNNAAFEIYYGLSALTEEGSSENNNVFRIRYDHKLNADHYLSLSAQKKSGIDKSSINPFEGNTVARIDFGTVFN